MDLSKIEGLTEEQSAAILAQYNADTEGLRNKNEQLLGEKKTVQATAAEQAQIAEDARKAAIKAEEEKLKAANDMEGLKAHYEEQLASATAAANEKAKIAEDALLSRDKTTVLNKALGLIHDDYKGLSEAMLSNMLNISYNDQGEAITEFKHNGEVVAKNVEEFKGWASEQDSFKKILNGVDSSGANTTQSSSSAAPTNKPYNEMSLKEQAAYLQNVNPQRN